MPKDRTRLDRLRDLLQRPQPLRSVLSLALPSAMVCHCMLLGASAPPQASGLT
jgi:hypothetical protein